MGVVKQRVRFTFPGTIVSEPIIWKLGHDYQIITSLRRADVQASEGWVVLELTGDEKEIQRGLAWVSSAGVRVDPVIGDVIEG